MQLMFVKNGGRLICGMQDSDKPEVIHNPRVVDLDEKEEKIGISILIGNPQFAVFLKMDMFYYNNDPEFEAFYKEQIK